MMRRQTGPDRWLIADARLGDGLWFALRKLPRGSGILVLRHLGRQEARRLRNAANQRGFAVVTERPGTAARVHNMREMTHALLLRPQLVLLSPIHATRSHPLWPPLPRMRAAALARLAKRRAIALGGVNAKRYANVAQLGFQAWAGIDAFRI